MKDRETPLPLLRKWLRSYPNVYQQLDSCATVKMSGRLSWPDYCPLPINAAYTHLHHGRRNPDAARLAAELTACWAWRRSRILYDVDDDMARVLLKRAGGMADSDIIPFDQLTRLPGHCVYVKVHHPDFSRLANTDGFFAWVDYDPNNGSTELRVQWLATNMEHTVPQVLRIGPGWTAKKCVDETFGHIAGIADPDFLAAPGMDAITHILLGTVQILLYIVSDGADIAPAPGRKHAGNIPVDPNSVGNVNTVDLQYVGARVGAVIRSSRAKKGYEDPPTGGTPHE